MCTHNQCFEQIEENISVFRLKIIISTAKKNLSILHMCVILMSAVYLH